LIEDISTLKEVQNNLTNIVDNTRIGDTGVVATLEVIKNQMFNKIMDSAVDHYQIVEKLIHST
jgi:hypothetical protein